MDYAHMAAEAYAAMSAQAYRGMASFAGESITMDIKIVSISATGRAEDAYIYNDAGNIYNGSAFVTVNPANWTTYALPLAETSTTGVYTAAMPAVASGVYSILVRERQSTNAAITDPIVAASDKAWNGTSFLSTLDLSTSLATIGAGSVTITAPVLTGGNLLLVKGDDYFSADGRALAWVLPTAPDLTGATIHFAAIKTPGNYSGSSTPISLTGSVVVPSGASKSVRLEIASSITSTLAIGPNGYTYQLTATLSTSHVATLATGNITVRGE